MRNLSFFDRIQVTRTGQKVMVDVQEKITLAPILSFTCGTSVKDLNATMGLVEYNLFGTGTQLGASSVTVSADPTSTCGSRNIPMGLVDGSKKSRYPTT